MDDETRSILLRPVMIVGAARSGTTWLQRMLLSVPTVVGGQESHFFRSGFGEILRTYDRALESPRGVGLPWYWERADLIEHIRDAWCSTMKGCLDAKPGAVMLVDKSPVHAAWLDVIGEVLPEARILHIVRDSRAVCASMLRAAEGWGKSWAPKERRQAARIWNRYVRAAEKGGGLLGSERFRRIYYERLHDRTDVELQRLFAWLRLDVSPAEIQRIVSEHAFQSQGQTGSGAFLGGRKADQQEPAGFLGFGKTDSWRNELKLMEALVIWKETRRLMTQLGYLRSGALAELEDRFMLPQVQNLT